MNRKPILAVGLLALLVPPAFAASQEGTPPESDLEALKILKKAESRLYSPLDDGLESLSFDQVLRFPGLKRATVSTWFQAPDRTAFDAALEAGIPNPEQTKASLLKNTWRNLWFPLGVQLGRPIGGFIDRFTVAFAEPGDAGRVRLLPKEGSGLEENVKSITCCIASSGLLDRIEVELNNGTVITLAYAFMKYKDTEQVLVKSTEMTMKTAFGNQKTLMIFFHREIEGFPLVASITTKVSVSDREVESQILFENFKVNQEIDPAVFEKGTRKEEMPGKGAQGQDAPDGGE